MSLLGTLGSAAAAAATPLTHEAALQRGDDTHTVRASRQKSKRPGRAGHMESGYDALIRISGLDLPVEPAQNDLITLQGETWIIWTVEPSEANASRYCKCMDQPAEDIIPTIEVATSDGSGGETYAPTDQDAIKAKVSTLSNEQMLTAENDEVIGRVMVSWPYDASDPAIEAGGRVRVRGLSYKVVGVNIHDDNPTWRKAMLVRAT